MRADPLSFLSLELGAMKEAGLYRRLRILDDEQKASTSFDHRSVVNLSSNNYLGLTTHPTLRARAIEAIERWTSVPVLMTGRNRQPTRLLRGVYLPWAAIELRSLFRPCFRGGQTRRHVWE